MRIFITQSNYPVYFTQKCAYSIPYFPVTLFAQVTSFTWNTLSPLCLLDSYFVSEVQLKNLLCPEFSIYMHALSLLLNYIIQYLLQQICSWCMLNKFGWVSGWTSCIHTSLLRQESAVGSPWRPCAVSEHEQEHWPFGSLLFANRSVVLQFVMQGPNLVAVECTYPPHWRTVKKFFP